MDDFEDQNATAALLRGDPQSLMAGANKKANRLNILAAVLQMANNPGAAAAAKMANQNEQQQYAPVRLGSQGFALPESGAFVPSPIYQDEQADKRTSRQEMLASTLAQRREAQQAEMQRKREHDESQGTLLRAIAQMNNDTKRYVADTRPQKGSGDAEDKAAKELDKNVTKFSATLEKSGVPEFENALSRLEGTLGQYGKGKLPGAGRLGSLLPNALADSETQIVRSNMQEAANIMLKARSGAAVTESEQRRFLTEIAAGKGMSEEALRNGWANVRKSFDAKKNNLISGVGDDVLGTYNERSSTPINRLKSAAPAAGSPPAGIDANVWKHMTPEEKALWPKS